MYTRFFYFFWTVVGRHGRHGSTLARHAQHKGLCVGKGEGPANIARCIWEWAPHIVRRRLFGPREREREREQRLMHQATWSERGRVRERTRGRERERARERARERERERESRGQTCTAAKRAHSKAARKINTKNKHEKKHEKTKKTCTQQSCTKTERTSIKPCTQTWTQRKDRCQKHQLARSQKQSVEGLGFRV